jgi:hypothetical protein
VPLAAAGVTRRLVLLGASNARRGFPTFVRTSRAAGGTALEIFGAFGHGRSYGKRSCVPFRCLPGILECGIWEALGRDPRKEAVAVITDVGNDLLYGEDPDTILAWVAECVRRLSTARITITGLPLARLGAIGRGRYFLLRSIFFPSSRQGHRRVVSGAAEVDAGLRELASATGARFVEPDPAWYGADPIHIRHAFLESAWARILDSAGAIPAGSGRETIRLLLAAPEKRWIGGIERRRAQPTLVRRDGTRVFLY